MNSDEKNGKIKESVTNSPENTGTKNIFDSWADFFKKMTIGIFIFAWKLFKWIGVNFVDIIKKICRILHSMGRLILWFTLWVLTMLLGWVAFAMQKFINFWIWVWYKLVYIVENLIPQFLKNIWPFLQEHGGEIWLVIAAIGSLYGIVYVARKTMNNVSLRGIFGLLKRNKKTQPTDNKEKENGTGSSEISM